MPLYTTSFPSVSVAGNSTVTGNESVGGSLSVSGNTAGEVLPVNHGVVAWSYDPSLAPNASLLTNGTVYLSAVYAQRSVSVTKLYWWVTAVGVTPTSSQNFVGIYDSTGSRLQTTNVDADITSTGLKTTTITSQALTAGSFYWVAMVFNAATAPTVARGTGTTGASSVVVMGQTAATFRYATNGTSQTSLPTSITPASNSALNFAGPWVAVGT
jgi:hypothetical protein